jgi:hypothetical protein
MNALTRATLLVFTVLSLPACNAIVGAECETPYTRCGRMCVDLSNDPFNCGGCANACASGLVCLAGACTSTRDAAVVDSGRFDGGPRDAGVDSALHDANRVDADLDADIDADIDAATVPACELGEILCDGTVCIDPTVSPCGDCTTICGAGEACSSGACVPTCDPLTNCGGACVDLTSDPDHCGACTVDCGSGICVDSMCESALAGHLVVIGHDYERRRSAMSSLLANAVLLSGASPVRIVGWNARSTPASIIGTDAGIEDGRGARTFTLRVATAAEDVPFLLDTADSFLVYAQRDATDAELRGLGAMWSTALGQFLDRGGVIVVLDAPSTTNAGTHQILDAAGLFTATATTELVTPRLTTAMGRAGDPVLVGVPLSYRGEEHTVSYTTTDPDAIVLAPGGPVVFDRTITP